MSFEKAMSHSWERLLLMVKAKSQIRANETLDLAQLIVAGYGAVWGDNKEWRRKQNEILKRLNE